LELRRDQDTSWEWPRLSGGVLYLPHALLHHSDRGSQYTSEQFQRLMADSGVICSMSRSGNVGTTPRWRELLLVA
jgi:transposase InsO family protein